MVSTAFSDDSTKAAPFLTTDSLASSKDPAESTSLVAEWTPFHRETAVGLEARSMSEAFAISALNLSRSFPPYSLAYSARAEAPARAILPAPRMRISLISVAVSAMMSFT